MSRFKIDITFQGNDGVTTYVLLDDLEEARLVLDALVLEQGYKFVKIPLPPGSKQMRSRWVNRELISDIQLYELGD